MQDLNLNEDKGFSLTELLSNDETLIGHGDPNQANESNYQTESIVEPESSAESIQPFDQGEDNTNQGVGFFKSFEFDSTEEDRIKDQYFTGSLEVQPTDLTLFDEDEGYLSAPESFSVIEISKTKNDGFSNVVRKTNIF